MALLVIGAAGTLLLMPAALPAEAQGLWDQQAGRTGMESAFAVGTDNQTDVRTYVGNIVKVFLGFLALIFLIIIILGGFKWMTASGNDDRVKQAKTRSRTVLPDSLLSWSLM